MNLLYASSPSFNSPDSDEYFLSRSTQLRQQAPRAPRNVFFFRAKQNLVKCWAWENIVSSEARHNFLCLAPHRWWTPGAANLVGLFSSELTTLAPGAYNWGWKYIWVLICFQLAEVVDASRGVSLPKHGGDVRLIFDGSNGFQCVLLPLNSSQTLPDFKTRINEARNDRLAKMYTLQQIQKLGHRNHSNHHWISSGAWRCLYELQVIWSQELHLVS